MAKTYSRHARAGGATMLTMVERLEERRLLSLAVQFDYSLDSTGFFSSADRRAVLQAAADEVVSHLGDHLSAITPSGANTWHFNIFNPTTGADLSIANLTVPADALIVYVGVQSMDALGLSGPATTTATGTAAWKTLVASRGQTGATGTSPRDIGPAGGEISFDSAPTGGWYFGTDETAIDGRNDFYSVAVHEMCHVLGFGTGNSWYSRLNGASFTGPASIAEHNGGVPLSDDKGHWASGTTDRGVETAMDPELTTGTRKTLTPLDIAGLDDIGWEIPIKASVASTSVAPAEGTTAATFTVTYSHFHNIPTATFGSDDVTVSNGAGFSTPATLVSTGSSGSTRTVTYQFNAPGGAFDASDAGDYTVTVNSGAVADNFGNTVPGGSLGAFALAVNTGPAAAVSVDDITRVGGASHEIRVNYSDSTGLDNSSFSTADLNVTRTSDGTALAVTSAAITGSTGSGAVTVTYVVAAPGGSWDAADNGTYTIALNPSQVIDVQGIPADAGSLGSFDVAINSIAFSTGNKLAFTDSDGDPVVISMTGAGAGQAYFSGTGDADLVEIILDNTAVSTALAVSVVGGGTTPIGALTVNGPLKSFTGKNADLAGVMTVSGAVPKILFRNASGAILLNGAGGAPVSITLAQASDLTVTSASPIKAVKVNDWLDTDGTPDVITAPAVASIAIKGAMAAGVDTQTLGKLTVGGPLVDSEIRAAVSIASIVVGSVARSAFFAGVRDDVSELPNAADQFSNPAATIKAFTVKGKAAGAFSDSVVAGANLGKVSLGAITAANNGVAFGVAALTAKSVIGVADAGGPIKRAKLDDPSGSQTAGDFVLRLL